MKKGNAVGVDLLVKWLGRDEVETTWEDYDSFVELYLEFDLGTRSLLREGTCQVGHPNWALSTEGGPIVESSQRKINARACS